MNYPEYVEVSDGTKYKINTDFRVALKCDEIAKDDSIDDYERSLAIIYLLFGEEVFNHFEHHNELVGLAKKYMLCGKEEDKKREEPDMDFNQDMELIRISFISDYNGLDLKDTNMHFWEFMDRINGLSNSELGDCCILNRVRNLRNLDLKDIKDPKEKQRLSDEKKKFALKKKVQKRKFTEEEQNNIDDFMKLAGIERR